MGCLGLKFGITAGKKISLKVFFRNEESYWDSVQNFDPELALPTTGTQETS